MHEFGFTDDAENIQALLLTNGDVEQALQIVIAMREWKKIFIVFCINIKLN